MSKFRSVSDKQENILKFIKKELASKGYPPSVREIGEAVNLKSTSTVHGHLERLEKRGLIRRDPSKPRTIELLHDAKTLSTRELVNVPIVGRVTAGQPILAVENIEDTFPIPVDFIDNSDVFILVIKGDSMIDAGILDNDYVLIRQQTYAKNGDIVVALLDDEATVKTFYKENNHIRLQPQNPHMKAIIVQDVKILGKVIGVFRFFR